MKIWVLLAAIGITACSDAAKDAEREYAIVEKSGSAADKCKAGNRVRDAYLKQQNQKEYEYWNAIAGTYCLTAEINR